MSPSMVCFRLSGREGELAMITSPPTPPLGSSFCVLLSGVWGAQGGGRDFLHSEPFPCPFRFCSCGFSLQELLLGFVYSDRVLNQLEGSAGKGARHLVTRHELKR